MTNDRGTCISFRSDGVAHSINCSVQANLVKRLFDEMCWGARRWRFGLGSWGLVLASVPDNPALGTAATLARDGSTTSGCVLCRRRVLLAIPRGDWSVAVEHSSEYARYLANMSEAFKTEMAVRDGVDVFCATETGLGCE